MTIKSIKSIWIRTRTYQDQNKNIVRVIEILLLDSDKKRKTVEVQSTLIKLQQVN